MKLRFLTIVPSQNPDAPFRVGQIIDIPKPAAEMRKWLRDGLAEVLVEPPEMAAMGAPSEQATEPRPHGKGSR